MDHGPMSDDGGAKGVRFSEKHAEAREGLPEDLRCHFDALVEEYRFYASIHYRARLVSYAILADLIRSGWRPTAEPRK